METFGATVANVGQRKGCGVVKSNQAQAFWVVTRLRHELRLRFSPFQFPIFCEVSVTTCHDIMHQHDVQFIMRFSSLFPMILVGSSFVTSCSRGADGTTLVTSRVVMLHPRLYVVKLRVEPAPLETTINEIVYH